jgi:hypothetical protein
MRELSTRSIEPMDVPGRLDNSNLALLCRQKPGSQMGVISCGINKICQNIPKRVKRCTFDCQ